MHTYGHTGKCYKDITTLYGHSYAAMRFYCNLYFVSHLQSYHVPQLRVPLVQLLCPLQAHGQSDTPNTKLYIRTCPVQVHRWPNTLFIYGTTLPAPSTASSWTTISAPRRAFHLCKAIVLSVTKYLFPTHFVYSVFQHIFWSI